MTILGFYMSGPPITALLMMDPVAAPRPKVTRTGRVYYPSNYTAVKARAAELVHQQADGRVLNNCPVEVRVAFVHARPKSCPKKWMRQPWAEGGRVYKGTRPDIDNLQKMILDAVSDAAVWGDDGQVARVVAEDWYAAEGEDAHIQVSVAALVWTGVIR
jgi:Holliday junction resolvase RusA-like endonuclease